MEEHQFHGKFDKNRGAIFLQQYICPVFFFDLPRKLYFERIMWDGLYFFTSRNDLSDF